MGLMDKDAEKLFSTKELLTRLRCNGTVLASMPGENNDSEWRLFSNPIKMLVAWECNEVHGLFDELQHLTDHGFYGAGFLSYEAGNAFEPELNAIRSTEFPLVQIAIFDHEPELIVMPDFFDCPALSACIPELSEEEYLISFLDIKKNIVEGNVYQANLTFRAKFVDSVAPEELFLSLFTRHPVPYAAFLNFGDRKAVSLSPELFIESNGSHIFSTPMKGTVKRHPELAADRILAQWLAHDEKNRAENLMITDMVRNDLGRICQNESILVDPLFHVETYRTVHQMVSTVHGELAQEVGLFDIMQAMFPPASITGAPKISAVNLISRNEKSPRKLYTGSIGCFMPNRKFRLNVAIRTLLFENNNIETGMGGGIVYDSTPQDEWHEALLKSRYATANDPFFRVFETILWQSGKGFCFEQEHLLRALGSQSYFGRHSCISTFKSELRRIHTQLIQNPLYNQSGACVKIILNRNGSVDSVVSKLPDHNWHGAELKVLVSDKLVQSSDVFLYHKTTNRSFFDDCLKQARQNGFDEVIFLNEKHEVTQGSISNIFVCKNNIWTTAKVECGLLCGIWRAAAIKELKAQETNLTLQNLFDADQVICGNSVRGAGKVIKICMQ